MYRKESAAPTEPEKFELPFGGNLAAENRWVMMATLVPWSEFEEEYAQNFTPETGAPAKSFRIALGALIIKEKLLLSDRETVEQIRENPYLQYFMGYKSYSYEAPFDPSLFVYFRERITVELVKSVNEAMVEKLREYTSSDSENPKLEGEIKLGKNRGKLILDATCAPGDISYPTDLKLLNQAREQTEKIIDILYEPLKDQISPKPRTYRQVARKDYLKVAKQRRPLHKARRKAISKQLQYLRRNLSHIDKLLELGASLVWLKKSQSKMLLVVRDVYRQQLWLHQNNKRSIENRIVSLTQPHLRPIVRGKAGKSVEFGAKLSVSCFEGYVFLDQIRWDNFNFNESKDLKAQIEDYYRITGYYPESVHVDKIYRTRENRAWCKERGIRISGPPLGRPPAQVSSEKKRLAREDEKIRSSIEGKFGISKRRYGLGRVMAKLASTSQTVIAITFLVMNLSLGLQRLLWMFLCQFLRNLTFWQREIIQSYQYILIKPYLLISLWA
ncbi:IS5 family transposase [Oscillatoriales cyanobacterium LEGE 11467]|uniref:IS5 family transposase n=1 Tax=Zarconia navalis LEGE 11467 TaxID=1828826 RepID=A0A928W0M6_9CYAN|nr:IS5 family transposase [Zarconia navalis]MBE9041698.1 IS5 family transposase [Zarconia navalis LEGE 11467]